VTALVQQLRADATSDLDTTAAALQGLQRLVGTSRSAARASSEAGAIPLVVQLLSSAQQVEVRAMAANAVYNFTSGSSNRAREAADAGAVPALAQLASIASSTTYPQLAAARTMNDLLRALPVARLPASQAALARDAMLQLLKQPGIGDEASAEAAAVLFQLCNCAGSQPHSPALLSGGVLEPAVRQLAEGSSLQAQGAAAALLRRCWGRCCRAPLQSMCRRWWQLAGCRRRWR
jgi:hypothetical protein